MKRKTIKQAPRVNGYRAARGAHRTERITIVVARFNQAVTGALLDGARQTLVRAGIAEANLRIVRVPGTFELPAAAALAAAAHPRPDAIIALGALIRGETSHYQVIAQAAAHGLTQVSVASRLPVTFGVIVAERPEQAAARAGGVAGNRGVDAAHAALEMLAVRASLTTSRSRQRASWSARGPVRGAQRMGGRDVAPHGTGHVGRFGRAGGAP